MILTIASAVLVSLGLLFFLGAVVGLVRFADFYTRMHAAGKGDTLSTLLILTGLALHHVQDFSAPQLLAAGKILFIIVFIFLTSPTTTHALMQAGYDEKLKPWTKEEPVEAKTE